MDNFSQLAKRLYNIDLSSDQVKKFNLYQQTLLDWNQRMNLTAIRTPKEVYIKHFLDSVACLLVFNNTHIPKNLIDVGTGAGFPGIVLKICIPNLHLTLVESIGKKAEFCNHIVEVLQLSNVEIVQKRAESLAGDSAYKERFDMAVARAVAALPILSKYLLPFVKEGGLMIAMKGRMAEEEIKDAKNVILDLGGTLKKSIEYTLPEESDPRVLVIIQKSTTG